MVGRREILTVDGEESAIRKISVDKPVKVSTEGLAGDEHAYHGHGGPDKALLHCAAEHYRSYRERFSGFVADITGTQGGFGENISTDGMTEKTVCVGDRYRIGPSEREQIDSDDNERGIVVEVTGFRQPCWKLGYNCGVRNLPGLMQEEGTTGWYYRVLETGRIATGDRFFLLERRYPEWPIARLIRRFYGTPLDHVFLEQILAVPVLGQSLREVIETRIDTKTVEPWETRLYRG